MRHVWSVWLFGALLTVSLVASAMEYKDIAYGSDPAQRLDVYAPESGRNAPVILMVHGGAWRIGDKRSRGVVTNKAARWVPRGFVFISTNYRMLPQADVLTQAGDVARALAFVQTNAHTWGGDAGKVILMGHSAGAHLASLLTANPTLATSHGARPWLGTVSLDSAAYDIPSVMNQRHMRLYDRAFGQDPAFWRAASPSHVLTPNALPLLAVCSSTRRDQPCRQVHSFAQAASKAGATVRVLEQPMSHAEINDQLGLDAPYTEAVERFLASLHSGVGERLKP